VVVALALAAGLGLGGCVLGRVESTTTTIDASEADAVPIAAGIEPWGAWRFAVAVGPNDSWCSTLDLPDAGSTGCTSNRPDEGGADLVRDTGGRGIVVHGPVGGRVMRVRVAFGDGTVAAARIVPAPGGMRFVVMPLPAAPVPETWQALDAAGVVLAEGSFR
jgi:hypothetical protein